MVRLSWPSRLLAILGVALAAAAAASMLPDAPYMRYATLDQTIQNRVRWIYERIHFDPTPIDVAVIGPSRSGAGVSAPRLEADLRAAGHPWHAVNFSLPENGRDLNWVILRELLTAKHPRLIVIGVIEKPSRFGHPAYKYIAPAADVIDPAYFGNLDYLSNLIYLPYRQLRLFAARFVPGHFGLPVRFDPGRYVGPADDTTITFRAGDGTLVERNRVLSQSELQTGVRRYEQGVRPPLLGTRGGNVEFGDERTYVARMAELAHAQGIRVVFLFLPYYTGPSNLQERALYERYGPVFDASPVSRASMWYSDVAHLNHAGALAVTDWLAPRIATLGSRP